jgi:NADH-dependent peroxiredoxin subunit C
LAAVAAIYDQFKTLNTEVLAISTDSVFSHKVFTENSPLVKNVQFPLLTDRTQKISRSYRVLDESAGAAFRATIIIDPEGKIVTKMVNPLEVGRNVYEVLRLIQALHYHRKTGEVMPANWSLGQKGITRNLRYIGRI